MTLHPLAERFADVAEEYERGRPEYDAAVIDLLARELGLGAGAAVLDLGAGTGKLSRALLAAGLDVVAVEPQAELRAPLAASIGRDRVLAGRAEAIPLSDGAVRAVTVGDAFHWFDQPAALREIRRVLSPGGGLAITTAGVDWSPASWLGEVGSMLEGVRPEHPHFDEPPWQQAVRAAGGWGEPRELSVSAIQPAEPDRFVDCLASFSWIAAMPVPERAGLLARVAVAVAAGESPQQITVRYVVGLVGLEQ